MSSVDEEKPRLPVIVIETHLNDTNHIHPELLSSLNRKSATRNVTTKNVDLNENTDGFITQINVEENIKSAATQQKYNIQTLNAELLIPTENQNNKKVNQQGTFVRHHSSLNQHNNTISSTTTNNTSGEIKKEASYIDLNLALSNSTHHVFNQSPFAQETSPPILNKLNSKVDFNDTILSDEYYDDLNHSHSKVNISKKCHGNMNIYFNRTSKHSI